MASTFKAVPDMKQEIKPPISDVTTVLIKNLQIFLKNVEANNLLDSKFKICLHYWFIHNNTNKEIKQLKT